MGMRCKRHAFQAGGGVCATCLRDRLLVLAAAQNDASSPPPAPAPHHPSAAPPPASVPAFPRSVSPYVSRRKSDASGGALRNHPTLLFFRTPQVGPAGGGALEEGDIGYVKPRAGRFSVLSTLFGNHHHHHNHSRPEEDKQDRKNRSWLAGIIPRRRRKQALPPSPPPRRSCRRVVSNRGLSPERGSQEGGSGDESTSPAAEPPWRPSPSPMRKTPCRRRQGQANGMPSGLAFCLSPLVRPSPGRRHRAAQPPDSGTFSCELRPSPLHSASSAASVPRCRSRKLADVGRFR